MSGCSFSGRDVTGGLGRFVAQTFEQRRRKISKYLSGGLLTQLRGRRTAPRSPAPADLRVTWRYHLRLRTFLLVTDGEQHRCHYLPVGAYQEKSLWQGIIHHVVHEEGGEEGRRRVHEITMGTRVRTSNLVAPHTTMLVRIFEGQ